MARTTLLVSSGATLRPQVVTLPSGSVIGELHRNWLPRQPLVLNLDGRQFHIGFGVTSNRYLTNDFRFELLDGDAVLASATKRFGDKLFDVRLGDSACRLVNRNRWFSLRFVLTDTAGRELGEIIETTGFSLWRRRFRIDMPESISRAEAMFLFFLANNTTYR